MSCQPIIHPLNVVAASAMVNKMQWEMADFATVAPLGKFDQTTLSNF